MMPIADIILIINIREWVCVHKEMNITKLYCVDYLITKLCMIPEKHTYYNHLIV